MGYEEKNGWPSSNQNQLIWLHRSRVQTSTRRSANVTEVFVVSSVPPEESRDSTLKLGHDRFLPNPFHFIIRLSPFHSTLHTLRYWKKRR
jgi:hypothetical protein